MSIRTKPPYKVLFISDLHVGHELGLWPDADMPLIDGREVPLNAGQKHLLECFRHATALIRKDIRPHVLIINGDILDGEQTRSSGTEAVSALRAAQVKAAIRLLTPLIDGVLDVRVIRGTPYHDGQRGVDIEPVAEALGATGPNAAWRTWSVLDLDLDGVIINVQHAISVATGFYRATPLDREGIWSALAGKEGKVPRADLVVRAHGHIYVHVEHPTKHILAGPCWQLQTEYMRRHSAYRMIPDIGFVVAQVRPEEKKARQDPIVITKHLYPLPPVVPSKVRL